MKSILPSGPLKTKLIIINYNNHYKTITKAFLQIVIIIKDLKNSSISIPSGPLKQGRRWRQREREKSNRFISAKQKLCTCTTLFCTFLSRRCTTANFLFLFLNLVTVLLDLTPENFANNRQIQWNWIRSSKFETVRIRFLSDVFGFAVIQKFCYRSNVT